MGVGMTRCRQSKIQDAAKVRESQMTLWDDAEHLSDDRTHQVVRNIVTMNAH